MQYYCNTIFGQLLSFLPKNQFNQFVGEHHGDKHVRKLTAWNQLIVLLYAQATGKKSLREIETGFNLHENCWYHLNINTTARSTLSDANNRRSCRIFEKLFYALLAQCREITPQRKFDFDNPLYSLDASIVNLCLSLFGWAEYRTDKGAPKLHVLLNNRTTIPELINITEGKIADISAAKKMMIRLEKGSILVFDRGYVDYVWWKLLNDSGIIFVSRTKSDQNIFVIGQHESELEENILADEIVIFGDYNAQKKYAGKLRRIKFWHEQKQKEYSYLVNNFILSAKQIADIYKDRWQIELFFKWIKQNLKIKKFLGTSRNAVLTQI